MTGPPINPNQDMMDAIFNKPPVTNKKPFSSVLPSAPVSSAPVSSPPADPNQDAINSVLAGSPVQKETSLGDQFLAGAAETGSHISKFLNNLKDIVPKGYADPLPHFDNHLADIAEKLNSYSVGKGEAVTGVQKVGRFLGGVVASTPVAMLAGEAVGPVIGSLSAKYLGQAAANIATRIASNTSVQKGITAGITSIPQEILGGVATQGVLDPESMSTPAGFAMVGGMSVLGSFVRGITVGAVASRQLSKIAEEATLPSTVPKTVDPSIAPALYQKAAEGIQNLKAAMSSEPLFSDRGIKLVLQERTPFVAKPQLESSSGSLLENSGGFASKTKIKPKTLTPTSDLQNEILTEGNKILGLINSKSERLESLQRGMEVDGESSARWNSIANLKEEIAGHLSDYDKEILPYVIPEMQATSSKFSILRNTDGSKASINLGKVAGENINANPFNKKNPNVIAQQQASGIVGIPNQSPTPFLLRGKPFVPDLPPVVKNPYTQAPPAPGVSMVDRFNLGSDTPAPPLTNGELPYNIQIASSKTELPRALSRVSNLRSQFINHKDGLRIFGDDINDPSLPYNIALRNSGSTDRALQNLKVQPMLPDGKGSYIAADALSMEKVFKIMGTSDEQIRDVNIALTARQIMEKTLKTSNTIEEATSDYARISASNPDAIVAVNEIFKRTKVQAEYLRAKVGDKIADAWQKVNYAPATRDFNEVTDKLGFLKKRVGGDEVVYNPIAQHIDNTVAAIGAADKNELWTSVGNLVAKDPEKWKGKVELLSGENDASYLAAVKKIQEDNPHIDDITAQKIAGLMNSLNLDKTNRSVTYTENGMIKKLAFHSDFDNMFEGMAGAETPLGDIGEVLRNIESIPRSIFSVVNDTIGLAPLKDIIESLANDPNVSVMNPLKLLQAVFVDPVRGLSHVVSKSDLFQQTMAGGGGIAGRYISTISSAEDATMQALIKSANGTIRTPQQILKDFSSTVSQVARMGAALRVFDNEGTADQAAQMFRHVIADPQQVGSKLAGLQKITSFMGMGIQSVDKAVMMAKNNPLGLASKGVALVSVPSAIFWYHGKDDMEIQKLRQSKGGEQYFYMRLTPDSPIIAWKKPFLYGQVFGTGMETLLDKIYDTNPRRSKQLVEGIMQQLSVNTVPLTLQTMAQGLTGYQFMGVGQGSAPIGGGTANQMAEDVRTNDTSTLARTVAEHTGISAAWIDGAIRTFATTEGARIINAIDRKVTNRTEGLSQDLPFVGTFLPSINRKNLGGLTNFYEQANKYKDVLASLTDAEKLGNSQRVRDIINNKKPEFVQAVIYSEGLKQIAELNNTIRMINENTLLSPHERREKINILQKTVEDFATKFDAAIKVKLGKEK